jgi:hypothetical protein
MPRDPQLIAIARALSAPFEAREVKFKPQIVKNNRALAMAYVDARLIQDRLDSVLGVENWQDKYEILADGSVMCRLRLKLGNCWITKSDVGSPSEQPDSGDRLKAAFSDALKRAAVKFGIGRYLYRLTAQWVDYDPIKKQLIQLPELPAAATPKPASAKPVAPGPAAARTEKKSTPAEAIRSPAPVVPGATAPQPVRNEPSQSTNPALPANGRELQRRLNDYDAKLAAQNLCGRGALIAHVSQSGVKAGFAANIADWSGPAIPFAAQAVKEFEQSLRSSTSSKPAPSSGAAA